MKIFRFLFFLCILLFSSSLLCQENEGNKKVIKLCDKAHDAIFEQNYKNAQSYLNKVFNLDTTYARAYIIQGELYGLTLNMEKAADAYNKAIYLSKKPRPSLYVITADKELKCGRYQEAYDHYQTFLRIAEGNSPFRKDVEKGLKICEFGIEAIKYPVNFNPVNLGPNINSDWDEYLPTLTADESELIFTVRRPRDKNTVCAFCLTEEDFYSSMKNDEGWQPRKPLGPPINTNYNEGAQCISPDGRYLFYTMCNSDFGYGNCDLYWSKRIGDRWSRPRNFGPTVNTKHWESQPSIAPDGKTIYFSSGRPGGYGGMDIWKTEMISEGVFSIPVNLGPTINTIGEEAAPFIHADGKTLYFASDGHPGMGGLDMFFSILLPDESWTDPVNLGYPINTFSDEINLLVNASGTMAYYSSDRKGGYGGQDLYAFELDEHLRPNPVTYIKGKVQDAITLEPLEATIELVDLNQNQIITSTTSDPITGEFLACILTGTNVLLNVSNEFYPFYSENFQLKKSYSELAPFLKNILLKKPEIGTTFILRNIFFDFDKSTLKPESHVELDNLIVYLQKNEATKIEIGGHTDNQGSDEYNEKLSLDRAKSVYNYLVEKGISANRLTYKGYGKNYPIATNDTEEGRAINRRTEFKIIEN